MSMNQLIAGFEHPVFNSLQNFRQLMDAMARPGQICTLPQRIALEGMHPASFSLLLTLLDTKSTLWLAKTYRNPMVQSNLTFHCSCECVEQPSKADFALLKGQTPLQYDLFNAGSAMAPHESTTLLVEVDAFSFNDDIPSPRQTVTLSLSGPGIEHQQQITIAGLDASYVDYLVERPDRFPAGLDMFFITQEAVIAIPRTTQITHVHSGSAKETHSCM